MNKIVYIMLTWKGPLADILSYYYSKTGGLIAWHAYYPFDTKELTG